MAYEASVAIWHGFRPIANGGWLAIDQGQIALYDGKGNLLASGPTSEAYAKRKGGTMGSGVSLWISGDKYMISPGSGNRPNIVLVPGSSIPGAGIGASAMAHAVAFAHDFYQVLVAEGGHHGAPE